MFGIYRAALAVAVLVDASSVATAQANGADTDASADQTTTVAANATGDVRVNEFLSYNPATKTANLRLVGGYDHTNSALNFNGGANGDQTVIMPVGWTVKASFVNKDGDLPHSVIIIDKVTPIPTMPPEPALPRAYTIKLEEGLTEGGTDLMTFKTSKAGQYWIFCGVPGHGVGGMYINLDVPESAKVPAYKM